MDLRLGLVLAGWLVGWWLLWRVPQLDEHAAGAATDRRPPVGPGRTDARGGRPARVSIIIPARNEASSISTLLASLARQTRPPDEIVVVDDQSEDATAALAAAHAGVIVVPGADVPAGWTGKSWACHQGARVAAGDVLLFLDADVRVAPRGVEVLLQQHQRLGGLVSVQPFHRMQRAYERLSALFNVIGFMGVGSASPGRRGRAHGAFGPCLVTTRADYERVGGHHAVRHEIVEDIALAHAYERAALGVHCLGGGRVVEFRMYPDGLGQLLEGWSKNFATGAGSVGLARLLLVGFWMTTVLISVQFVIEQSFGRVDVAVLQIALIYAMFAFQLGAMLRQLGNFTPLTATVYPALIGVFLVVFAHSVYLTLVRRRVVWRGRSIALSTPRRAAVAALVDPTPPPAARVMPRSSRSPAAPASRPTLR